MTDTLNLRQWAERELYFAYVAYVRAQDTFDCSELARQRFRDAIADLEVAERMAVAVLNVEAPEGTRS